MSSSRTAHRKRLDAGGADRVTAAHTRALDVPDDGTGLVVHELDADLGDTTTGTCVGEKVSVSLRGLVPNREGWAYRFCRGHG